MGGGGGFDLLLMSAEGVTTNTCAIDIVHTVLGLCYCFRNI